MLNPHQVHSHFVSSFAETRPFTDETEDHPTTSLKFKFYLSAWLYAKQHTLHDYQIKKTGFGEYELISKLDVEGEF